MPTVSRHRFEGAVEAVAGIDRHSRTDKTMNVYGPTNDDGLAEVVGRIGRALFEAGSVATEQPVRLGQNEIGATHRTPMGCAENRTAPSFARERNERSRGSVPEVPVGEGVTRA